MVINALKILDELDKNTLDSLLSKVDYEKKKKLESFFFQKDLYRSLFAEILVRKYIIEKFNLLNEEIVFSVNQFGKPFCNNLQEFHFNVSHSGDWIVCAFDDKPVGVDVEEICLINLDIAKSIYSTKENDALRLSSDPLNCFFTLWTLKESYVKFIGEGLQCPLNSFSIQFSQNGEFYIEIADKIDENIHLKLIELDAKYKVSVCGLKTISYENIYIYTLNDIFNTII